MTVGHIFFFADRLPPLTGGMEMHAKYFMEHFKGHLRFPLSATITKDREGNDCIVGEKGTIPVDLDSLPSLFQPTFIFFNSGRWIEELEAIRELFPHAIFIYRTGGNEIIKASLIHKKILEHSERQKYWITVLNRCVDLMITNSSYTETRLRNLSLSCPFYRCVGGVHTPSLKPPKKCGESPLVIFCAARFVAYKNHALLVALIKKLILLGHNLELRLAGDGPLLKPIKEQVENNNLSERIKFLGVLDNEDACFQIAQANVYMQLSSDTTVEVPGGTYVHSECMGRSILEALTAGTFVVAGHGGALSEIVSQDRGLLVDLDDLEATTNKIDQVLRNPPKRRSFSDEYCWTKIFTRYEKLMENFHENISSYRKI